ncbi:Fe2+ or Zn2+ uptake regulation protein [Mariniphaga anaerophila]|uniref:Fe2+ or Zn2+ uptake regulation protein n=2 Tax=Mariniphaga anaerophila TaxID=1484053 RepID=A0A1M4Y9Y2_9BACT|nr:Fe2+ or Zn2+ uptake regulation protein [Mariniphaga anaerophila]
MCLNENNSCLEFIDMKSSIEIRDLISGKGLKVTPQRMRVMEAIYKLNNHPTADNIIAYIRKNDPNVGSGTVYKVLETLVENKLIKKVKTERDIMRYDGILENHHHLYCIQCDYIEDYKNEKLDKLLKDFFVENEIENFVIEDVKLSINGNFIIHKNQEHN